MKLTIVIDATKRPELFCWAGAVQSSDLDLWMKERGWNVPEDLRYFWSETGGGDFFESETIFAPFCDLWADDSVESVNRRLTSAGMPKHYLAFHTGLRLSAVDLKAFRYMFIDEDSYQIREEFPSLEAWYLGGIRTEFVDRYSLAD